MSRGSVINFPARRQRPLADRAGRTAERNFTRANEADEILRRLLATKRLTKADQLALVSNLGRLITQFDAENAREIAKTILQPNELEKRKRYILFPHESDSPPDRSAGSGGSFARIIERFIEYKVNRGAGRDQARAEAVRKALRGTSFLPPQKFRMTQGIDDADAVQFAADMKFVMEKFAEEADLAEFLALLSKHPVYPTDAWYQWNFSLCLSTKNSPNRVYEWEWYDDDFEDWIPWWAPRCLIGYLYIPFECRMLNVPEHGIIQIREALGSVDTNDRGAYYSLFEPFINKKHTVDSTVYHRLPVWLIALALPSTVIPCLYVAIHHPGGFYQNKEYFSDGHPVSPCFVDKIGESVGEDAFYVSDDNFDSADSLYVRFSDQKITAIGSEIDGRIGNFKCDLFLASMTDEIPQWLHEYPVQRFLPLTLESDAARLFALSPRRFYGRDWDVGDRTIFRPAFADAPDEYTSGLRQDTIAAYLLRSIVSSGTPTIFSAIRSDALEKYGASRQVVDGKTSKFRELFEERFDR